MESFYPKMTENDPSFLNVKNEGQDIQDTDRVKYLADEKDVMEQKCPGEKQTNKYHPIYFLIRLRL